MPYSVADGAFDLELLSAVSPHVPLRSAVKTYLRRTVSSLVVPETVVARLGLSAHLGLVQTRVPRVPDLSTLETLDFRHILKISANFLLLLLEHCIFTFSLLLVLRLDHLLFYRLGLYRLSR